jgi:hypothetical protein
MGFLEWECENISQKGQLHSPLSLCADCIHDVYQGHFAVGPAGRQSAVDAEVNRSGILLRCGALPS